MSANGRRLRLYTDEDVDGRVAKQLQRLGHDVLSSHAAGNSGRRLSDEWQLKYATEQGRAILSHNSGDFYQLAHSWALSKREHYGIVLATPYAGWESYSTHDQASRPG
ncbi:DUF5615 family PIN-like protein [soil metagenome]